MANNSVNRIYADVFMSHHRASRLKRFIEHTSATRERVISECSQCFDLLLPVPPVLGTLWHKHMFTLRWSVSHILGGRLRSGCVELAGNGSGSAAV